MPAIDMLDALKSFTMAKRLSASGQPVELRVNGTTDLGGGVTRLRFAASTGAVVPLGATGASVQFHASDDGGFNLHLCPDAASASRAAGVTIKGAPGEQFAVLNLYYDTAGSAKTAVPLTPGVTAALGASASRKREWSVVHAFRDGHLIDALRATLGAWILPGQIESPDDLAPGTWIVVHTSGSLKLSADVTAGYNFSWLRELANGAVSGDLGLKLNAAHLAVGFETGGDAVLIVARETDAPVLRVTVKKSAHSETSWNAAAGAAAVAGTAANDLVNAIFGIHPAQLVEDLRNAGPEYTEFLRLWDRAGAHPASTLLGLVASCAPAELTRFSGLLDEIQQVATNPLKVTTILEREFGTPRFFSSPLARMLAAAPMTASGLTGDLNAVRQAAIYLGAVRDLLRAHSPFEKAAVLGSLPPFAQLDSRLKAKLAAFVGRDAANYTAQDHDSVTTFFAVLTMKSARFLSAAVEAARKRIEARVALACQNTSTNSALIDAEFDFAAGPATGDWYRSAVAGDFTRLLTTPSAGVRLRKGALTHGIKRQYHAELSLPFCGAQSASVLSSLAKLTARGDHGRVLAYELDASDEWSSEIRARFSRDSRFGVMAKFASLLPDVRSFGPVDAAIGYSLTVGVPQLSAAQMDRYLSPVLDEYFPPGARDRFPTSGVVGDCRAALDIELPADALAEWFEAPADEGDAVYFKFARLMQLLLRRLVRDVYFSDPGRYATLAAAAPVLVWSSLPALNSFDGEHLLWDASDPASYHHIVEDSATRTALRAQCAVIAPFLAAIPRLKGVAQFYDVTNASAAAATLNNLLESALHLPALTYGRPPVLSALVGFEQDVIRTAVSAAVEAGRFREDAGTQPAQAIHHLTRFGDRLVSAFHARLRGCLAVPASVFTPLGAGLLAEAGRALRIARTGDDSGIKPAAMFSLTILKGGSNLTPAELQAGKFDPQQIAAERRVVAQ